MLQIYMQKETNIKKAKKLILMGGFLGTKYYDKAILKSSDDKLPKISFDIPILTINGELDNSTVRSAESFFLQMTDNKTLKPELDLSRADKYPIVLVKGMNHVQVADGKLKGTASSLQNNELRPEIDLTAAHEAIANLTVKFINDLSLKDEITESWD